MGMFIPHDPLHRVIFTLTREQYENALITVIERTTESVKVRKARIEKIRKDNELDDATYLQVVQQFSSNSRMAYYSVSASSVAVCGDENGAHSPPVEAKPDRIIAAGVVASLMAEEAEVKKEQGALATFTLHLRNAKHATTIELTEDDLKFLGL